VASNILGQTVVGNISAQQQRRSDVGGSEGVVYNYFDIGVDCFDSFGDSFNVDEFHGGVGGSLDPDEFGLLPDCVESVFSVTDVNKFSLHSMLFVEEPPHVSLRASVDIITDDDVVSLL